MAQTRTAAACLQVLGMVSIYQFAISGTIFGEQPCLGIRIFQKMDRSVPKPMLWYSQGLCAAKMVGTSGNPTRRFQPQTEQTANLQTLFRSRCIFLMACLSCFCSAGNDQGFGNEPRVSQRKPKGICCSISHSLPIEPVSLFKQSGYLETSHLEWIKAINPKSEPPPLLGTFLANGHMDLKPVVQFLAVL